MVSVRQVNAGPLASARTRPSGQQGEKEARRQKEPVQRWLELREGEARG